MAKEMLDPEIALGRFNRLIQDLLRGNPNRNCFYPFEIELLLDMETCDLGRSNKREVLRQYQKAVQRHFERGGETPLKLSEYLAQKRARYHMRRTA